MSIKVSVIIPTFNRGQLLVKCLKSLSEQTYPHDQFEVIVVDDGSTDNTEDLLKEINKQFPFAFLYLKQRNSGPAMARNLGAQAAKGFVLAFTDSDCLVDSNWLQNAMQYFKTDCTLVGVEGATHSCNYTETNSMILHQVENRSGTHYLTCNMFYRKEPFLNLGMFDVAFWKKGYPYILEDSDLAATVLENGYQIIFAPEVIIKHPVFESTGQQFINHAKHGFFEALFYKKHPRFDKHSRPIPYHYYGYYLALMISLLGFINTLFLGVALIFLEVSYFITVYARVRKSLVFKLNDFLLICFLFLFIPYLRGYYVMKGNLFYKKWVW